MNNISTIKVVQRDGGGSMATKSIMKNIEIKDRKIGERFAEAIEAARTTTGKDVEYTRPCKEVKGKDVKALFDQ